MIHYIRAFLACHAFHISSKSLLWVVLAAPMVGVSGGGTQGNLGDAPGKPEGGLGGANRGVSADAGGGLGSVHGSDKGHIVAAETIVGSDAEHRPIPDVGAAADQKSSARTYSKRKIAPKRQVIQASITDVLTGKKGLVARGSHIDAPRGATSPTSSNEFM